MGGAGSTLYVYETRCGCTPTSVSIVIVDVKIPQGSRVCDGGKEMKPVMVATQICAVPVCTIVYLIVVNHEVRRCSCGSAWCDRKGMVKIIQIIVTKLRVRVIPVKVLHTPATIVDTIVSDQHARATVLERAHESLIDYRIRVTRVVYITIGERKVLYYALIAITGNNKRRRLLIFQQGSIIRVLYDSVCAAVDCDVTIVVRSNRPLPIGSIELRACFKQ